MSPQPNLVRSEQPRLHGQFQRIMSFYLAHPGFWTLTEIARAIGAISEAGLSMRLRELTYEPYRWVKVVRMRKYPLREYSLTPPKHAPPQLDLL